MKKTHKGIFVTGTGTGIGKTLVSAVLMLAFRGVYWKPVQTGTDEDMADRKWIQRRTLLSDKHFLPEVYRFRAPCSPHLAAQREQAVIDLAEITKAFPCRQQEPLIVEGAGGLMVPLNSEQFMLDLIRELGFPAVVVASSTLGTINHSLLTLDCLKSAGLEVKGVILSGPAGSENKKAIEYYGNTRVLTEIDLLQNFGFQTLERISRDVPDFLD